MLFEEIKPFVRYVRLLKISEKSKFEKVIPLDARIFYLQSGKAEIEVSGNKLCLSPGDLLYINSGTEYEFLPGNALIVAVNFDFTYEKADIIQPVAPIPSGIMSGKHKLIDHREFSDAPMFNSYVLVKNRRLSEQDLKLLLSVYEEKMMLSSLKASSILTVILIETYIALCTGKTEKGIDISEIINYIHKNYGDGSLNNKSIAQIFGYHPNYMNAEFKRAVGCPIHNYLLKTRITSSISLIECGEHSITEISEMCGFSDVNYFSKVFKRVVGCPPTHFRHAENISKINT